MSEMDSLKQELEKKALALVAAQSELSTATEVCLIYSLSMIRDVMIDDVIS